jgi:predicted acetyltransferase
VYERDGACRGYAAYRTKGEWTDSGPNGTVRVMELVALDADAHGALWRFLLGIDLMRTVSYDNLPPDDPLPARLRDPRRLRGSVSDGLYVRLLDVPRALTSRSYAAPARAVVEVVDEFGGWAAGRWLLDVSPEGANCVPTTESADVTLGAAELGATHLGDTTLRVLYGAGRVDEHTAGTVAALSRAFAGDRAAWCPEIF